MPGGFSYDAEALNQVSASLRNGAERLRSVQDTAPDAPDAGASSQAVGTALSELMTAVCGGSGTLAKIAENVHATKGSYADVENTGAGMLQHGINTGDYPMPR